MRPTNSIARFWAKPSTKKPISVPSWLTSKTGLRPKRSLSRPSSGPESRLQAAKLAPSTPMTSGEAPKCFA